MATVGHFYQSKICTCPKVPAKRGKKVGEGRLELVVCWLVLSIEDQNDSILIKHNSGSGNAPPKRTSQKYSEDKAKHRLY